MKATKINPAATINPIRMIQGSGVFSLDVSTTPVVALGVERIRVWVGRCVGVLVD